GPPQTNGGSTGRPHRHANGEAFFRVGPSAKLRATSQDLTFLASVVDATTYVGVDTLLSSSVDIGVSRPPPLSPFTKAGLGQQRAPGLSGMLTDLRYAVRLYVRTPVSSAVAVAVIAVAMGAVATFLSLYNDLMYGSQSEFEGGGEIITVAMSDGVMFDEISLRLIDTIDAEVHALDSVAGSMYREQPVLLEGEQTQLKIEFVTDRYFPDFRPRLLLGLPFNDLDH